MTWHVYVVVCFDNSFYCGITTNIERRLKQHNGELSGGAKYTRSRRPCRLVYKEKAENRSSASKKEYWFKKLSRKQKEKYISYSSGASSSTSAPPSEATSPPGASSSPSGASEPATGNASGSSSSDPPCTSSLPPTGKSSPP